MTSVFRFCLLPLQYACLLTILGIVDQSNARVVTDNQLPRGYIYHPEIKSAYKLFTTSLSWSNARLACQADGARLAVVDTSEKLGLVSHRMQWGTYPWVGIFRDGYLSPWIDVNGDTVASNLPWGALTGGIPILGNCVTISGITRGLASMPCFLRNSYICEIPGERRTMSNVIDRSFPRIGDEFSNDQYHNYKLS